MKNMKFNFNSYFELEAFHRAV